MSILSTQYIQIWMKWYLFDHLQQVKKFYNKYKYAWEKYCQPQKQYILWKSAQPKRTFHFNLILSRYVIILRQFNTSIYIPSNFNFLTKKSLIQLCMLKLYYQLPPLTKSIFLSINDQLKKKVYFFSNFSKS